MAVKIGSLVIQLAAESGMLTEGFKKARRDVRSSSQAMQSDLDKLQAGFIKLGKALASAFAGAGVAMAVMARQTINTADEISKAAQAIGMGTEELSRLRYAADISGVSFEALQKSIGVLNRGIADLAGKGNPASKALDQIGIATRNSDGSVKTSTQVLKEMAAVFERMPDGAQKSAIAMAVFGKAGAEMIPFLNQGAEGIAKLTAEADKFGVVIDAETGRKAEEFNDNITRLKGTFSSLATRIAADMLPRLVELQEWLIRNQDAITGAIRSAFDFAGSLVQVARSLAPLAAGLAAYRTTLIATTAAKGAYTAAMIAATRAIGAAQAGTLGLNAALAANPIGAVAAAVGVLTAAVAGLAMAQANARAETDNLIVSLKSLAQARSADFKSQRALLAGELAAEEGRNPNAGFLAGLLPNWAKQANASARVARIEQLRNAIKGADQAYAEAEAAAAKMEVPVVQSAEALNKAGRGGHAAKKGIDEAARAAEEANRAFAQLVSEVRAVQNQLDPVLAKYRTVGEQQGKIFEGYRAGLLTKEEASKLIGATLDVKTGIVTISEELPGLNKKTRDVTREVADNFAQMSDRVMNSLQGLSSSIKSGDFLGILGGLVNMFVQLGSTGLFGKTIATNINAPVRGAANGTAYHPGGLLKVGERGPEILQVPRGGRVVPNHELRAAGEQQVRIILDERTDIVAARIDGRIGAASGAIAEGGAQIAQARLARRQTRRIG